MNKKRFTKKTNIYATGRKKVTKNDKHRLDMEIKRAYKWADFESIEEDAKEEE